MSSKKVETADELLALFNDPEKLAAFSEGQLIVSVSNIGFNKEVFHMELPYEEIKVIVENERDKILEKLPEDERESFDWEHVGSTSIKGMPGTMMPDALILLKEYPPSRSLVQALLDLGYYFVQSSPLDVRDLWFFLEFTDGLLKDRMFTVHITTPDNTAAKILLDTRNMCRNEQWAFEDYKNAKIEASKALEDSKGGFMNYKRGKGSNSKLLTQLKEKYKM